MGRWFSPDDGAVILVGITLASKIRTKTQANSAYRPPTTALRDKRSTTESTEMHGKENSDQFFLLPCLSAFSVVKPL
jgi:hypothetical protein